MSKKKPIGQADMFKYIRLVLGFKQKSGISVFITCCKALAADSKPKIGEWSDKVWVHKNAEYIKRRVIGGDVEALNVKLAAGNNWSSKPPKAHGFRIDPNSPEFLASYEWRTLRMEVLTKYGPRCMCCGATPDDGLRMHVDHIKPRKKYPGLALIFDNLQVLCEVCNHGKSNWDETDWRPVRDEAAEEAAALIRSIAKG